MWLRSIVVGTAIAAPLLLMSSGLGVRFGLWGFSTGFMLLRWSLIVGLAAAAGALVGLSIPGVRRGFALPLVIALALGLGSAFVPFEFQRRARAVPPINDIATDLQTPYADQQRQAYPDIQPLRLPVPPAQAYPEALAAAQAMGWEIVSRDPVAGRFEAVDTTLWFGFKDDVTVRVAADGTGSRVDVRSKSRVGKSDIGTNAKRIRAYLQRLR
jgi:uncharacterized protein (DUF1499 family)